MTKLNRFTIRSLLVATGIICISLAYTAHWLAQQRIQNDLEWDFISEFQSSEAGNLFTEESYVLPEFVIQRFSTEDRDTFYRVTTLDFTLDNLNTYTDDQIERLAILKSVHTVRLCNPTLRPSLIVALKKLPALKYIDINGNFYTDPNGDFIAIQEDTFPGVEIRGITM